MHHDPIACLFVQTYQREGGGQVPAQVSDQVLDQVPAQAEMLKSVCALCPFLSLVVAGSVCKHVLQSVSFSQQETHLLVAPVDCGKVLQ